MMAWQRKECGTLPAILLLATAVCMVLLPVAAPGEEPVTSTSVQEAAEKAAVKAIKESVAEAAQEAADKAAEKAVEKVTEKAVEKAAEKVTEKAVEKATEKVMEQREAEATAKAEQTAKRPEEWRGPTKVHFLVFIADIDQIDDANQNFTANIYLRLRWQDRRLASPGAPVRQIPLESVWNPRVLLVNLTGLVTRSLPEVVQVEEDGTVTYHQRYTGKLSQILHLFEFPRDQHTFVVQFVAAGYQDTQLDFIPDILPDAPSMRGGSIAQELSLPDWQILSHEALKLSYQPIPGIHAAGFGLRFEARRYLAYYLWQVVLPLGVVVIMSGCTFWVPRTDAGVRIGVATSSVLTLIAHRFVLAALLPRLPYMTRMDYLTVGSALLVLLSLFLVTLILVLEQSKRQHLARQLDLWARGGFPVAFLLMLGWFMFG